MRTIWAIIGAIAGFVVGGAGFLILAYLAMGVPSLSEMEGSPIGNVFQLGPLAGLLGLGLGIWLALRLTRRPR